MNNSGILERIKYLILATRPWSFPMTAVSVGVGNFLALQTDRMDWILFLLVLGGMILLHGATNLFNDYHDYLNGVDTINSPTALYRPHPLVEKKLSPPQILFSSLLAYLMVVGIGVYLFLLRGVLLLIWGLLGMMASLFYTQGPVRYKYHGLGELSVFFMWGPLMVSGAYYVQTGHLAVRPVVVSIPLGILVALVLLANNLRDLDYDRQAGITTLATLCGEKATRGLFNSLVVVTYLTIPLISWLGFISIWGFLILLSVPNAFQLLKSFRTRIPEDADARTAKLNLIFGGLLWTSLWLEKIFPLK